MVAEGRSAPRARRWLRRGLWLAAFGALWLNVLDDPPLATGAYVQHVTTDGATIAKITAAPAHVRCVVRRLDGAVVREVESHDRRRRHALRIEGLTAASDYAYALSVDGVEVEQGRIRTAPAGDAAPVRFAFVGDSGGQPWWVWLQRTPILHLPTRLGWFEPAPAVRGIGAAVAAARPEFMLHLGDVIYPRGQHAHYRSGFFAPFADLLRAAPVYVVLGNHDVMDAAGQQTLANFHLPTSAATGDERCYSFPWGPVRVIALDCNTWLAGERFEAGHPSLEFLIAELERCSEPWVVVASHFPMRSASRQRDRADLLLALLPELEQHQVSLYLSGHDHCYQRFEPDEPGGVPLVVSGGGGKSLYDVRPHPKAAVLASDYHWCSVELRGDSMRVEAHALDGRQLDAFERPLPAGEALQRLRERNPKRASRIDALRR